MGIRNACIWDGVLEFVLNKVIVFKEVWEILVSRHEPCVLSSALKHIKILAQIYTHILSTKELV